MGEEMTAALIGLVAGAISGFVTAVIANQFERRKQIDESVRAVRELAYARLWRATSLLPLWPRAVVTGDQLLDLSKWLRQWYFGDYVPTPASEEVDAGEAGATHPGGMYLSREARLAYTGVQTAIQTVLTDSAPERNLTDGEYDSVREACSQLRSELTADLLSRKRAFLVA